VSDRSRVVVWVSAGVTSAWAAKMALDTYPAEMVRLVCCDTGSEDDDNFRFMSDVDRWLGIKTEMIKSVKFTDTMDVFRKSGYIKGRYGAPCTLQLKKVPRRAYENLATDYQVFGYSAEEEARATRFMENNPEVDAWFPLIENGVTKAMAREYLLRSGVVEPRTYSEGFSNANCLKTGCVKGAKGYWNHVRKMRPEAFLAMAQLEREVGYALNTVTKDGARTPVFLDELDPVAGNYKGEPPIQCGLFCEDLVQ